MIKYSARIWALDCNDNTRLDIRQLDTVCRKTTTLHEGWSNRDSFVEGHKVIDRQDRILMFYRRKEFLTVI